MDKYDEAVDKAVMVLGLTGIQALALEAILRERSPNPPATQDAIGIVLSVRSGQHEQDAQGNWQNNWTLNTREAASLIAARDAKLLDEAYRRIAALPFGITAGNQEEIINRSDALDAITGKGE